MNKKRLIIQTAFIGDVILATGMIEYLKKKYPNDQIDFLLRRGNEKLLENNPHIGKVLIWEKKQNKIKSLLSLIVKVRKERYDAIFNIQRFFNSGLITAFSRAKLKIGFHANPLSMFFHKKVFHKIPYPHQGGHLHEVQRNFLLLQAENSELTIPKKEELRPVLYFSKEDQEVITKLSLPSEYFVMAPSSVWYTKQWHLDKWKELIHSLPVATPIYLLGAPSDNNYVSKLVLDDRCINLCGKLSLPQSAMLMKNAKRVFVNDSAPLHLASSVNAKTTAIFCSTVPEFGYGPLSEDSHLTQLNPRLECMPCGLHGHKDCPRGHFKCAMDIDVQNVFKTIL